MSGIGGSDTSWFQMALAGVGGFMAALIGAFTAAWHLSGQLRRIEMTQIRSEASMQKYIDDKLMDTRHTLIGRLDQSMMTLTEKIEAGEQRIMDVERFQEQRIRDVERVLDRFSGGSGNKS